MSDAAATGEALKRGRPRGARLNKKARWQPRKWEPLYDQMVALSCTGLSNTAIAERFGYTPQQVSNILTSDNGKLIKELVSRHIQTILKTETADRLARTEKRANEIIAAVLDDNELLAKHPIAMYDRAIKFLEGRGKLEAPEVKKQQMNNFILGDSMAEKLIAGITKANEAAKIHNSIEVRALPNGSDRQGAA